MCSNTFVHVRGVPRIGEKGQSIRPPLPVPEISLIYNNIITRQYLHRLAFWSSQPPSLAHQPINSPSTGHVMCKADILKTIHSTQPLSPFDLDRNERANVSLYSRLIICALQVTEYAGSRVAVNCLLV